MRATVKKKTTSAASHTSPQKLQKRVNQIWGGETVEQKLWIQPVFDDAIMRPLTRWRGSHRVVAVFKSLFFIMENRRAALRDMKDMTWRTQKTKTFIDIDFQKMASFVALCTAHCKAFFICGVFHWQAKDFEFLLLWNIILVILHSPGLLSKTQLRQLSSLLSLPHVPYFLAAFCALTSSIYSSRPAERSGEDVDIIMARLKNVKAFERFHPSLLHQICLCGFYECLEKGITREPPDCFSSKSNICCSE